MTDMLLRHSETSYLCQDILLVPEQEQWNVRVKGWNLRKDEVFNEEVVDRLWGESCAISVEEECNLPGAKKSGFEARNGCRILEVFSDLEKVADARVEDDLNPWRFSAPLERVCFLVHKLLKCTAFIGV